MKRFVEETTCDRCGHMEYLDRDTKDTWGEIKIPKENSERHLCPDCLKQFADWWIGKE